MKRVVFGLPALALGLLPAFLALVMLMFLHGMNAIILALPILIGVFIGFVTAPLIKVDAVTLQVIGGFLGLLVTFLLVLNRLSREREERQQSSP